ncbi:hypothetical protein [Ruegeria sp. EL01]|nr:hypothetical protein [Ruegeria sp. EL01]
MKVIVKAFNAGKVSPDSEAKIGRLMKKRAEDEGHKPRLPGLRQPWNAAS